MSEMDATDLAILKILLSRARLSNVAIGQELGISHSTVSRRIESMERSGLIEGYTVVLNKSKIGLNETVFVMVQLKAHGDGATIQFEDEIARNFPNVVERFKLNGSWDYLLKVTARNMAHYDEIHTKIGAIKHVKLLRSFPAFTSASSPTPLD